MALNGRAKNRGREWDRRVDAMIRACKINSTAKMTKPLTEVRKQGKVSKAWAAGDGQDDLPLLFTA